MSEYPKAREPWLKLGHEYLLSQSVGGMWIVNEFKQVNWTNYCTKQRRISYLSILYMLVKDFVNQTHTNASVYWTQVAG